jgi:hypothetical protein
MIAVTTAMCRNSRPAFSPAATFVVATARAIAISTMAVDPNAFSDATT